jgi:AcrR family transcriptional regulator
MIAREAGVTAPVLYECFPSKGALLRALLEREEGRLREQLAASLALDTDRADFRAILEAGFRAYLEAVVALPDSWRVVVHPHLSASPEAIEAVENARAGYVDGVRQVVERALRTQGVTLEDAAAHAVAVALVGTGEALARLLLDAPDRYAPAPLAALAADAFSGLPATVAADS